MRSMIEEGIEIQGASIQAQIAALCKVWWSWDSEAEAAGEGDCESDLFFSSDVDGWADEDEDEADGGDGMEGEDGE
eukprot:519129-Rhodomonas_salina.1